MPKSKVANYSKGWLDSEAMANTFIPAKMGDKYRITRYSKVESAFNLYTEMCRGSVLLQNQIQYWYNNGTSGVREQEFRTHSLLHTLAFQISSESSR